MTRSTRIPGYQVKGSKVEKVKGYKMNVSQKIRQKKSKKVRVTRRAPD
jgi:hypothetical protein